MLLIRHRLNVTVQYLAALLLFLGEARFNFRTIQKLHVFSSILS